MGSEDKKKKEVKASDVKAALKEAQQEEQRAENDEAERDKIVSEEFKNVKKSESVKDALGTEKEQIKELGKFKNPQELLRAYTELEKEFTRRSQRLAALEKELEEERRGFEPTDEEWKEAVDKFFEKTPAAKPFAKDIAVALIREPELRSDPNCLALALTKVLVSKFRTPEELMEDGEFLNDYVLRSEKVRQAVIGEYLNGLAKGLPPATLSTEGEAGVAPASKPKNLEEAGILFLKNNK